MLISGLLSKVQVFPPRNTIGRLLRGLQGWQNSALRLSSSVPHGIIDSDYIVRSSLPELPSLKNVTVPELIFDQSPKRFATNWGNRTAYECSVTGYKLSHNEVQQMARSFGTALLQSGLKRGDMVVILLPNCPQYGPIIQGMFMTGIVASPMNPALTPVEIGKMMQQTTAKAVVTFPEYLPIIRGLQGTPAGASIKNIILVGESREGCHNFADMAKVDSSGTDFLQGAKIDATQEPALVLWSSGTTGPPKGAILTHSNLAAQLEIIVAEGSTEFVPGVEVALGLIPFFHVMGSVIMCNTTLQIGATCITVPKFDPQLFTKVLKTYKFTVTHVVPPLIGFLAANPALTKEDFDQLHCIVCGGAPAQEKFINGLLQKIGKYVFYQEAYGMTETTGATNLLPPASKNTNMTSAGPPAPSVLSKVIDVETGKNLGPNQRGELLFKGPQVMKGYLNNEAATKEIIDSEGWLHSGDIGYYNDDGYLYVVDRLKELIKVKGLQVSPTELEQVITKHPKIADVAVIGVPNERAGELPRAYVVRRDPNLTQDEINIYLSDKLAEHKQLEGGVEFVDAIPKSPSGKILRKEILASYKQNLMQ